MTRGRALTTAVLDGFCIVLGIFVMRDVYLGYGFFYRVHLGGLYETVSILAGLCWFALSLWVSGGSPRWTPFRRDVFGAATITVLGGLVLAFAIFAMKISDVSRVAIAASLLLSLLFMVVLRLVRRASAVWTGRGPGGSRTLLVANRSSAETFATILDRHPEAGQRLARTILWTEFATDGGQSGGGNGGATAIADLPQAVECALAEDVVDDVVLSLPIGAHGVIEDIAIRCARQGKPVRLLVDGFITRLTKFRTSDWFGQPVLSLGDVDDLDWHVRAKRIIDVAGSALLLLVASPVLAGVAIAVKVGSPGGPVLFRQERVGKSGRRFACLKFRSMVPEAESLVAQLRAEYGVKHPVLKLADDPRITRVGRFLRRTSLDELPQLWNVLRGEMSLVGPRPLARAEVDLLDPHVRKRLSMRPGLTCLWQVTGRSEVDWERRMDLDLEYVDRWSLWLDLSILVRTLPAVFAGRGAY